MRKSKQIGYMNFSLENYNCKINKICWGAIYKYDAVLLATNVTNNDVSSLYLCRQIRVLKIKHYDRVIDKRNVF